MKRVVSLVLGGLALLAIGGFAGWRLHRPGADARAYAEMRLIAVQVSLDEAPPDYVFWAGDSQVELQPGSQRPAGSISSTAGSAARPRAATRTTSRA